LFIFDPDLLNRLNKYEIPFNYLKNNPMKKLSLFVLMAVLAFFANAQCGNFIWENKPTSTGKVPPRGGLVHDVDDQLKIGNSLYLVRTLTGNIYMGMNYVNELTIEKYNYQTFETESKKSFIKTDLLAFKEATGIDREKEYLEGSFIMSDRILIITTVKVKKQKEIYCVARIISPELEIEKYVVFDTIQPWQSTHFMVWGNGVLFSHYNSSDVMRGLATTYYFQAYDVDLNPLGEEVSFLPSGNLIIGGMYGILGLEKEGVVIAESSVKGGKILLLFDLKNQKMDIFNLDIKERLSEFKYKLNKEGDLICAGFYLVDGGVKDLPDVQGIYLTAFKRGTVENLYTCKIGLKPSTFDRYCATSVNMTKTYLRYFKLVDICFDQEGNTVLAGERIEDQFRDGQYAKSEIVVFTFNNNCEIINEHHIPKMLVQSWGSDVSCDMFSYKDAVYLAFRDNPLNLDNYDKNQTEKLVDKSRGMYVLVKLDKSGKYVKKCMLSQEENFKTPVSYHPSNQNFSSELMFNRSDGCIGRYLMDKE
jgi:hypothetical protein